MPRPPRETPAASVAAAQIEPPVSASTALGSPAGSYAARWSDHASPEFVEFRAWTELYHATPESERAGLVESGVQLARARRAAMAELIKKQPMAALEMTVPGEVRRVLPAEVAAELESRVSGTGDLSVVVLDNLVENADSFVEEIRREVELNGRRYAAHVYGRRLEQNTEYRTSLHGVALDGHLALHENPVRWIEAGEEVPLPPQSTADLSGEERTAAFVAEAEVHGQTLGLEDVDDIPVVNALFAEAEDTPGPQPPILYSAMDTGPHADDPAAPTSWTTGTKRILVLPVDFSDRPGWPVSIPDGNVPITPQLLRDRFATQVAPYFSAVSHGKASLAVTVADKVYRAREPAAVYVEEDDVRLMHRDILTAAGADWNAASFDVVILVFSDLSDFPNPWELIFQFKGGAEVGGSRAWINGWPSWDVLAHEIGHTYGLRHAHALTTRSDPFDGNEDIVEYGDLFDVMGSGDHASHAFNVVFKHRLGWIAKSGVRAVAASGTYRVFRSDAGVPPSGGLAGLMLSGNGEDFWIAYQKPSGAGGTAPTSGVYLRAHTNQDTRLHDLTPSNPGTDVALPVGASISNDVIGFTITPVREGGTAGNEYIDVNIQYSPGLLPIRTWGRRGAPGAGVPLSLIGADVVQVATRVYSQWALKSDGTLESWGLDEGTFDPSPGPIARIIVGTSGGLPVGAIEESGNLVFFRNAPTEIRNGAPPGGLTNVARAAIGARHIVVLKRDGSLLAWGDNSTGATDIPHGLQASNVVDVGATESGSCVLRADGSVPVWGNLRRNPTSIDRLVAIAPTSTSIVGLEWHGRVVEWGDPSRPPKIHTSLGSDIRGIAAAPTGGVLALRENGKVLSWTTKSRRTPAFDVPADLPSVKAITLGGEYATAIVNPDPAAITVQPFDQLISEDTRVRFTAFAVGPGKLSYRWQRLKPGHLTWANLTRSDDFQGTHSRTLQVSTVRTPDRSGERYRCVVTATNGFTVTSREALLLMHRAFIGIAVHPSSQAVNEHGSVTLAVKPYGESPFSYQWFKDGAPLAGRTGPQLTIRDVRMSHAGDYTVRVSNAHGHVLSSAARLTVRR